MRQLISGVGARLAVSDWHPRCNHTSPVQIEHRKRTNCRQDGNSETKPVDAEWVQVGA